MSNNFYPPNDPAGSMPPYPPQPDQGQQGQLILGKGGARSQPQLPTQRPGAHTPSAYSQQNSPATPQSQYNAQQGYAPSRQPGPRQTTPASGQMNMPRGATRRKKGRGCAIGCGVMLVILIGAIIASINLTQHVLAFGSAISPQAPLSTQTGYMSTDKRTNLLVLGYGGGNHDGALLTDSNSIISMVPSTQHTTLIAIPRDLWVTIPDGSTNYGKINSIYEVASNNNNSGQDRINGGNAMALKVSKITGLTINYWMLIDFEGFQDLINSLGGVDINVPDSFNACYPKSDTDPAWIKVQFNKGLQHMDGVRAIEYARAREPLEICGGISENEAELSDFARSARQQIIIKAALSKMKDISSWPHLYDEMNALQKAVYTNMSLADLALFADKMNLNDPNTKKFGLSNSNVLVDGQASDGEDILEPKDNDWTQIPPFIQQNLYP